MSVDLVSRIELIQALERRDQLKRENGLVFYQPHPKQEMFHGCADFTFRYLRTGNRFGKSDCGAAEDCAFALGERPWIPKHDSRRYAGIPKHSVKLLIVCTDWKKADEIFTNQAEGTSQGKLFNFLPKDAVVNVEKDHGGHIHRITVKSIWGGYSTINLDTVAAFQQNEMKAESSAWDAIHVDEPIPKDMWTGLARGLMDRNGKAWFTCTPLTEPWINDFFKATKRDKLSLDEPNIRGNRVTILGKSTDNPHISVEGIENFFGGMDEKTRKARLEGVPLEQTGLIYTQFDEMHVYSKPPTSEWPSLHDPPRNYTIRYALDPHPSTPHAILFAATSPEGKVYFFDEIWDPCTGPDLAKQVLEKIDGRFLSHAIADPSAYITSGSNKRSLADDFADEHLLLEKGAKDPSRGIIAVQAALQRPGFLNFSANLDRLLWEMDRYVWDRKRLNKPRDKDDHMMENLYRLVLAGLDYIPVESDEDYKKFIPFLSTL